MCTVHSFPHNIDHCLTFARSEFEGHLEKAPAEANAFLLQPTNYLQVPTVFAVVCLAEMVLDLHQHLVRLVAHCSAPQLCAATC